MQPLNYAPNVQNPMEAFQSALAFGDDLRKRRMTAEAAEAEAQRQAEIDAMFKRLREPGATVKDYMDLAMILPKDQSDALRESFKTLKAEEQTAALNDTAQIFAAFKAGRPDVAQALLRAQGEAERNAGNEQGFTLANIYADMIDTEPGAIEALLGYSMAMMPGGDKAIEAAIKFETERRTAEAHPVLMEQKRAELSKAKSDAEIQAIEAKYAEEVKVADIKQMGADLGLTNAQINKVLAETRKLDAETRKLLMELEGLGKGNLTPEKVWEYETKLRGEYTQRTKSYDVARQQFETIEASAADNSGAGDVALVFGFMRMLDPDSVVRESEFAAARDTTGLYGQLQVMYDSLRRGAKLSPQQRQDFIRLSRQYWDASQKTEQKHRDDLAIVVRNYGLNPENVFGTVAKPGQTMRVEEVDF